MNCTQIPFADLSALSDESPQPSTIGAPHFHVGQPSDALCHSHLRGQPITIRRAGDTVILSGVVQTYFQKQIAQESIRRDGGAVRIINRIEVAGQGASTAQASIGDF